MESFINIFQEEEIINQTILYSQESIALAPSQLGYIATLWLIFPPTINASWFSDKIYIEKKLLDIYMNFLLIFSWFLLISISTFHPFQAINSQCVLMAVITITILLWFCEGENKTKTVNIGLKLWISYPILLVEIMIVIIRIDQEKYLFSLLDLCPILGKRKCNSYGCWRSSAKRMRTIIIMFTGLMIQMTG